MKNKYFLLLILIFAVAFFIRFYKLGEVPFGFYQDESAIGYNAFSIMETGRDEHGRAFPLYFQSFGDYKLPVYIYTTIISLKLFGLTEFAVRMASAFFGFLTVVVFFFFVKQLTKDQLLAFVATALLAINPWHLHYSRATFEVSIALFLFVLGGFFLHKALNTQRKGTFLLGALCFIVSLYSYNLTRLLAPILFLLFLFLGRKEMHTIGKKEIIATIIIGFFLLIPFVKTLFESGGVGSASGTLIFSSAQVQAQLLEFRSYLVELPSLFVKLFFNQWALTKWQYIENVASYFSVPFFFVSGSSHGNHGIGNVGQFYLFELPLIVIGVSRVIRERWGRLIIICGILVILIAALTREAPHATRSFFLIAPLTLLSASGALTVLSWLKKGKGVQSKIFMLIFAGFIFYSIVYYFTSYYVRFPIAYASAWRQQDKALSLFLSEVQDRYDHIIFDKEAGFIYTSLLFYQAVDPHIFQREAEYGEVDSEGFQMLQKFGKYEFKDLDWDKDYVRANTLLITTSARKPTDVSSLKTFSYPQRPVVIAVGQEIKQYPAREIVYEVVETKQ